MHRLTTVSATSQQVSSKNCSPASMLSSGDNGTDEDFYSDTVFDVAIASPLAFKEAYC